MTDLKPAYLICGDDDTLIDAWRARVRARAEREGGPEALERFDAGDATPADVAAATQAMTLAATRRFLLVEDAGGWKASEIEPLERALASPSPDVVLVLIVRGKASGRLRNAVEGAGGEVREQSAPKPRQLPSWVAQRARENGLQLDAEAAKTLVASVGNRPARLLRELEKVAVAAHPRTRLSAEEVEALVSAEATAGAYELADALVSGDRLRTMALAEEVLAAEPRPGAVVFPLVRRLRDVHRARELLDAGFPAQKVAGALAMPPWAAKRAVSQAHATSRASLEGALRELADFELRTRSGEGLDEATELSLALARATA